jgi:paraquat-inducible protein A
LLQRGPAQPARKGRVLCARCGALLYRKVPGGLRRAAAFAVTAGVLFVIANASPIVSLEAQGNRTSATLLGAVVALWGQHLSSLAVLVLITAMLMPALEIGVILYVLAVLRFRRGPHGFSVALRLLHAVRPWSMIEVLVLGTLAALGKLIHLARIELGPALWSLGALMALMAAIPTAFDVRDPAVRSMGRP